MTSAALWTGSGWTLPRARLVEIPSAVHTLHEDNPEAVLAALREFLVSATEEMCAQPGGLTVRPAGGHTCLASITGTEVCEMPLSISVRLPSKTAEALDELASATDRSRTYLIVRALEAYLADHADYQVALDRLRDKDDPVISSRELRRRLGRKD